MDSLLASYASDDDDDGDHLPQNPNPSPRPPPKSLLAPLPRPKSASFPPPSAPSRSSDPIEPTKPRSCSLSSGFRALPPPASKSFTSLPPPRRSESGKRVVQIRPVIDPSVLNSLDDDDADDKKERERKKKKLLVNEPGSRAIASLLPPPQHSLSNAPSGRRVAVETSGSAAIAEVRVEKEEKDVGGGEEYGSYYGDWGGGGLGADASGWASYESYENYGNYGGEWGYGAPETSTVQEAEPELPADFGRMMGKRGRREILPEIVEVKQEELVKDRPREDQTKVTGIAFGPAYQPISSLKGKPSKLHKRKHQIGSLYFDMKQKEMELTERRARGMLTKRETQGKYGW